MLLHTLIAYQIVVVHLYVYKKYCFSFVLLTKLW